MRAYIERLLAEFVDREDEFDSFRQMLDSDDVAVFAVWGPGGIGKSSFQAKMIHEVATRGLDKSEVIWSDTRSHDFIAIARKIRDDLGPAGFGEFTDLINFFTVPQYELKVSLSGDARISVLEGATIEEGAKLGDVAGVVIRDVMLTEPRNDMEISASERRARLTDTFIACAGRMLAERPAVIFFDATEKTSEETEDWVWRELLPAACEGRMGRVKFVLCGRNRPEVDRLLRRAIAVAELKPLTLEHVLAYLELRGVREAKVELASMLLVVTQGNMLDLATHVDAYLKIHEAQVRRTSPAG